ncbi:nad-dependent aldehyde dehydrogenase [Colletotrichum incanum]|uniref:Nad-dependent aldehyde dehydrogenase n=1 Tax=Colletotrichum incanum TaxID=1573173 RepID=A0A167BTY1_COLIC|nr:nad-dependent aldehyde dehydrogenase [Colletotrichum incanum]
MLTIRKPLLSSIVFLAYDDRQRGTPLPVLTYNGQWVTSTSNETFPVFNPVTEEFIGTCPDSNIADLNNAIESPSRAFPVWKAASGRQRGRIIGRIFDLLVENKEDLGKIITAENGKSKGGAEGKALFAASFFEWFGEEATRVYGDIIPHSNPTYRTRVIKEPVGVCVAAALAAGCTVVMKTDGLTPFSSSSLAVLCERAGVPPGVFNVVKALENTPQLGLALCESDTSSSTLKKLSLELGGNAPFIVFDDADLETAISSVLKFKFKVTGRTCVCANRIFIQQGIYDRFSQRLVEEVKRFHVGNGIDAAVTHSPLTNGVGKVEEHIKDAVIKNSKVLLGGNRLPSLGKNFHELTIIGDVDDSMKVTQDESFGPLAALTKFTTGKEVIERANKSELGLALYIVTNDRARSHRVSEHFEFGMVTINTGIISDASAPFGGVKHSGFSREGSKYGLEDYLTIKMIVTGGISANL